MSQQQQGQEPERPVVQQKEAVKYGDVLAVSGDLASKVVAAMMQTAENAVLGQTEKGGTAAVTANEKAGFVGDDDVSDTVETKGVTVTEMELPTARFATHSVGEQVVGQFLQATPIHQGPRQGGGRSAKLTIGEALEAVAVTTGDKPVEQCDAAAIQAAEVRATGSSVITPGGLASSAQSAASMNAQIDRDEDMIKLGDVLTNATLKLAADKEATRADAEGVMSAELRNNPNIATHPAGVAASVLAAARLNEGTNP